MQNTELLTLSLAALDWSTQDITASQVRELQEIIRAHNTLYYIDSAPIIDDGQWSKLFRLLVESEERLGILDPHSPTSRVDVLLSRQFTKASHLAAMISLDNTYDAQEVLEFGKRIYNITWERDLACILELKFDGLGLSLLYEGGLLKRALTRGNGLEGEDVTINSLEIPSIPRQIGYLGQIEIRGEVVMPHSAFARVNAERASTGEKLFANPRNAASGSLRQLDPLITRSRGLEFYGYSVPVFEEVSVRRELGIESYSQGIAKLAEWGFLVSPFYEQFATIESLSERVSELASARPRYGFDIDGLVIKLEDYSLWSELGTTAHHPRCAIAYKFPQEAVMTRVEYIEHSVGRTGAVTPVAHMEAVNIGGVVVRRATLHNYEELERKDIRIGDRVYIERAGEVIPEIVSLVTSVRDGSEAPVMRPTHCPSCGTPLTQDEGKVALYCPARSTCPAQTSGGLKAFVSKHAANIDGMGEKIVDGLLALGYLSDFVSIYHLSGYRSQILELEGFEELRTDNLLRAIEASRGMSLDRMLLGLCIPEVGRKTARILSDLVSGQVTKQWVELPVVLKSLTYESLIEVRDIGPVVAQAILDFIADHRDLIERLIYEVQPTLTMGGAQGILGGKSFCVTGSFEGVSRDDIHAVIEAAGGLVRTGVTAKLDYLVVGSDAGSKLAKATELGVSVVSWEEVRGMVE